MARLYRTAHTHNYGVEFSPFTDGLMAVASSQYFGVVGNGKQIVVRCDAASGGAVVPVREFETQDGVYDSSWSEMNPAQLVSALADGSLKLWDLNSRDPFPIANFHEHTQEAASVDWNLVRKDQFISASWDSSIKLWSPMQSNASLATYMEHTGSVYNAQWNPRQPNVFVSCASDGTCKIWDTNQPRSTCTVNAHQAEVLAVDWNKYNEHRFVSGSVDRTIKVWDTRNLNMPINTLYGHNFAVRRLKCSPHNEHVVASVSYDMSCRVWNTRLEDALLMNCEHHSEFVCGVDFNLFRPGQLATASWDEFVCVFDMASGPPPSIPPVPKVGPTPPPPSASASASTAAHSRGAVPVR